uniref:DUF5857 domain-containing protein n=1 Tax=Marseillevirus LCMAC101 TaxID=2506602 RepID=A0A481YTD3_9VIRU|nr:MAG: hypothetical protein LCMAC101_03590 [Marseillevirus LCMAC101]
MSDLKPDWLSNEWCHTNNQPNCTWYTKITTVNGGPDTNSLQWLDWDESSKKFIWTSQTKARDTDHRFWINPKAADTDDKAFMRVAKTKDSKDADEYTNLSWKGNAHCDTQSNIGDCIIHHDRGVQNSSGDPPCTTAAFGTPNDWNNTYHSKCNPRGYDNDLNRSTWAVDLHGGLYNRIEQEVFQSWSDKGSTPGAPTRRGGGPQNCCTGNVTCDSYLKLECCPIYFLFGKAGGINVDVYPGSLIEKSTGQVEHHEAKYWSGCGEGGRCATVAHNMPGRPDDCKTGASINDVTWISETTAKNCCGMLTSDTGSHPQCGSSPNNPGAFSPCASSGRGFCSTLMNLNCNDSWSDCATSTCTPGNDVCNDFLRNGSCQAFDSARMNITDYINNSSRTPTDYISWALKYKDGSPSANYYNKWSCKVDPYPSPDDPYRWSPDSNDPCDRDDSKDPFFTDKLVYLCNATSGLQPVCKSEKANCSIPVNFDGTLVAGTPTGRCDDLLHYFCQQFTRDDVEKDATLVGICGCSLLRPGIIMPYPPPSGPSVGGDPWTPTEGTIPTSSPYDQGVPETALCDTPCMNSKILQSAGSCTLDFCMIDGVTLNYINSDTGDTNIKQQCGGCGGTDETDGTCQCYMGDITINEFNSSNPGGVTLEQACGDCYQTDVSGNYVPYNCKTGVPLGEDTGEHGEHEENGGGKKEEKKPWWKKKITLIMLVIIVLALVLFLGFWYSSSHRTKTVPDIMPTFDDYYYY